VWCTLGLQFCVLAAVGGVTASGSFARKFAGIISSSSKFRNNEPHLTGIQIAIAPAAEALHPGPKM